MIYLSDASSLVSVFQGNENPSPSSSSSSSISTSTSKLIYLLPPHVTDDITPSAKPVTVDEPAPEAVDEPAPQPAPQTGERNVNR